MKFALYNNQRTKPTKGIEALCPCCNDIVLPVMGDIYSHHWRHHSNSICNIKPITEWHINWQNFFPDDNQEVIYKNNETEEKHIADVSIDNLIFEFQHSPISKEEFEKRIDFYINKLGKKLIWVFDYTNTLYYIQIEKYINPFKIAKIKFDRRNFKLDFYNRDNLLYIYDLRDKLYILLDSSKENSLAFIINKNEFNYKNIINQCFEVQKEIYIKSKNYFKIKDMENKIKSLENQLLLETKINDNIRKKYLYYKKLINQHGIDG